VGGGEPDGLGLEPVEEAPAGLAGHLGEGVAARAPVGPVDLGRVVGEVAPEQGRGRARADQQALGPRGVARGVQDRELGVEDLVAVQQLGHPQVLEGPDAAVERQPALLGAGRERLPVAPLDQVAGPREQRPGRPAVPAQVPADVVEVQVGEDDQVDLVHPGPGGGQLLGQLPRRPDPLGPRRPGPADPGIDQDDPAAGPDHEAPVAQPPAVGTLEHLRVAAPVGRPRRRLDPREGLGEGVGEVGGHVEDGRDLGRPDGQGARGHAPGVSRTVTGTRWTALLA
jgi:hypothetical protein